MPQDTLAGALPQGARFLQQSGSTVAGGWWVLVIVIIVLLFGIAGVLLWQRKRSSPFRARGVRASCQLCGRERRVPPELLSHLDDFVCRDCVRAAFPEMNDSQPRQFPAVSSDFRDDEILPPPISEEELRRSDRLAAMKRAKSQTFKIKRMTSTFFRVRSDENPLPVGKSKSSLDVDDLACDENDGTCKVCFEDPATIVLLPCGHGGLCQGCAKELVLSGKPCYICGEEFHMIAELKAKSLGGHDDDGDDATAGKERFIGLSQVCECALALNRVMEASGPVMDLPSGVESRDRNRMKSIQQELDALRLALVGNLSLVHLRLGDWNAAIAHADIVLASRPTHCKALYRRALARFELDDTESHELGYRDLKRVLQLDPSNKEAARRLAEYQGVKRSTTYDAASSSRSGLDAAMQGVLVDASGILVRVVTFAVRMPYFCR
ncbi:hypothetical protein FOL47_009260 [Perkinsus chesapeaki]|uniref:RING-type domain-containing protein n=1 Tax=Perkinsus chesapeaki TaxID=330153 RepID=A0A7J6L9J7_PERCH|nr:hypothetical protein FOL47_009260 [Perkinsus chesapeaki]